MPIHRLTISLSLTLMSFLCCAAESNLDDFSYPTHSCGIKIKKPTTPKKLLLTQDIDLYNAAIIKYNINVTAYNKTIKEYKLCINQYIKNGNHDVNIIRKKLNRALKEARAK